MANVEAAPAAAASRRWTLAAAIASIAVFGVTVGLSTPLLTLLLDARGVDPTLNGSNAAVTFVGVILGPFLTPPLVRRFGVRAFLLGGLALDVVLFLLLKPFDSLAAWFVLRAALGLVGSAIFTATEAWINMLANDASRGRVIGVYIAALYGGFALGPMVLWVTGIAGWLPFLAAASMNLLAMLPLLRAEEGNAFADGRPPVGPLAMLLRAPFVMLASALFGLVEQTNLADLPLWGVRIGMLPDMAGTLLTATALGALALQPAVGWLSDFVPRPRLLRLCTAVGLVGAVLLAPAAGIPSLLYALLFLWSGVAAGIYPVALGMLGDRFSGGELVGANAAMIICYGIGSLVGPPLGGLALHLWSPHGLIVWLAAVLAFFLAVTLAYRGRAQS
jgi:MFS family permease